MNKIFRVKEHMASTNINEEEEEETDLIIPEGVLNPTHTTIIKIPSRLYNTGPLVVVKKKHQNGLTNNRAIQQFTGDGKQIISHIPQCKRSIRHGSELERLFTDYKPLTSKMSTQITQRRVPSKTAYLNLVPYEVRASLGCTEISRKMSTLRPCPISPRTIEITAGGMGKKQFATPPTKSVIPTQISRSRIGTIRLTKDPSHIFSNSLKYLSMNYPTNFIKSPPDYPVVRGDVVRSRGCQRHDSIAEIRSKLYAPLDDRPSRPSSRGCSLVPIKSVTGNSRIQRSIPSKSNFQTSGRKIDKKSAENYCDDSITYMTTVPVKIVG